MNRQITQSFVNSKKKTNKWMGISKKYKYKQEKKLIIIVVKNPFKPPNFSFYDDYLKAIQSRDN